MCVCAFVRGEGGGLEGTREGSVCQGQRSVGLISGYPVPTNPHIPQYLPLGASPAPNWVQTPSSPSLQPGQEACSLTRASVSSSEKRSHNSSYSEGCWRTE